MPTPSVNVYNPNHQVITLDGEVINGWAEDDFFTLTFKGADTAWREGADGTKSVAVLANGLVEIKFSLMHGTKAHKTLMAKRALKRVDPLGPTMKLAFIDTDFRESWNGEVSFTTPAGVKKGKAGGDHEWNLEGEMQGTAI